MNWKYKGYKYLFHDTGLSTCSQRAMNHMIWGIIHWEHMNSWHNKASLQGDLHGSYNYCSKSSIFIMLQMLASKSVKPPSDHALGKIWCGIITKEIFGKNSPQFLCAKCLRGFPAGLWFDPSHAWISCLWAYYKFSLSMNYILNFFTSLHRTKATYTQL